MDQTMPASANTDILEMGQRFARVNMKKKTKNIQATYMFPSIYSEARQLACVCSCLGSLDCLLFVTAHRKQTEAVGQHWCTHTRGLI